MSTGAFDDRDLAGINASDRELIAPLMNARPKDPVARTPPSAVPEADVKPQLPVNEMVQRATLALEQVAGRPSGLFNVEKVDPKFKLLGAQGRVQQDSLNKAFNDDPAAEVREFEAAVKSLAAIDPPFRYRTMNSVFDILSWSFWCSKRYLRWPE